MFISSLRLKAVCWCELPQWIINRQQKHRIFIVVKNTICECADRNSNLSSIPNSNHHNTLQKFNRLDISRFFAFFKFSLISYHITNEFEKGIGHPFFEFISIVIRNSSLFSYFLLFLFLFFIDLSSFWSYK